MNKRALAGRAFTLIAAVGIIAIIIIGFVLTSSTLHKKQAFDVSSELNGLNSAAKLRVVAVSVAPELMEGRYASIPFAISDAFGPKAKFALYVNGVKVAGEAFKQKDAALAITVPKYDGAVFDFLIEVKQ